MSYISKEFAIKVLFFVGISIILTSFLTTYLEKQQKDLNNSSSFSSLMLEIELASTKSELLDILSSQAIEDDGKALNLQNFYNTYLYFSYSVFILLIFLFFYKINTHFSYSEMIFGAGLALSFIILAGNLVENIHIHKLASDFFSGNIDENNLTKLIISSRVKFTAIFISSMLIFCNYLIYCRKKRNIFTRVIFTVLAVLYLISGISGYFAVVLKDINYFVENSLQLMILCWIATIIHSAYLLIFENKD